MSLAALSSLKPNPSITVFPLKKPPMASLSPQASFSFSPRRSLQSPRSHGTADSERLPSSRFLPNGLCNSVFLPLNTRSLAAPRFVVSSSAASHEESRPDNIDVDKEINELKEQSKESVEAWEQALATFKEQALKLQNWSLEACEAYSEKSTVLLKEALKRLKIEADKARYDISLAAKELGEEGKQLIIQAAEDSPDHVKDVVDTFTTSTDKLDDVSKVHDFYVGVPYGAILLIGGFLNFMITGSTSGIRFGVILGGALLALSLSSLRLWRQGKPADSANLKGEIVIAGIIFLRELRLVFQKQTFPGFILTFISGAVAAFFLYRLTFGRGEGNQLNLNDERQS